ncbi:MAG: mandelate racemase/muconate lactonizing enzyme family protein [Chloroflexi bacterium]|nr:mandelate racemase/muconate lactonizing enzyme family protein [Chloroflexota bacterium]
MSPRIRAVRAHYLRADLEEPFGWSVYTTRLRQALLVEVETDDGLIGWGEAGSGTLPAAAKRFVEEVLGPLAVGQDPFDLNGIWQRAQTTFDRAGWGGGLAIQALSGLEVALWDLMGKATNRPVCQLLGGRVRDRVQAYATGLYYYPSAADPSAAREEEARGYVERGYRAMKMKVGGLSPAVDLREVERIRRAVGDDVTLLVDANGAYDSHTAIQVGGELDRLGVAWFEEPVQRGDVDGYLEVKRALRTAIAGGEHLGGCEAFRELLTRRAVDIAQPDVANCGGLSEARRIAAVAGAFHVRVFPHVWGTPLAIAAGLHFAATLPSTPPTMTPTPLAQEPIFEFDSTPHPIREAMMTESLRPLDGWLRIPDGPGLGVEVDPGLIARLSAD